VLLTSDQTSIIHSCNLLCNLTQSVDLIWIWHLILIKIDTQIYKKKKKTY